RPLRIIAKRSRRQGREKLASMTNTAPIAEYRSQREEATREAPIMTIEENCPMLELWSVSRAAKFLDVSKKRVYQLIQQGRLESLKLSPRTTRVTRESVERLVEEAKRRQRDELGLDFRPQSRQPRSRNS
ncbi:MAG: helix-turn-helix domain-containing protein, partial [Candidatus Sumerlaeaceae bacterium]